MQDFEDYVPTTMELRLESGRMLPLVEPSSQDICDGIEIIGKPYEDWWETRTVTAWVLREEDDPEGRWKKGDAVLDADGEPVSEQRTTRTPPMQHLATLAWLMARKAGLSIDQIEAGAWPDHCRTLQRFRILFPLRDLAPAVTQIVLFFYAAVEDVEMVDGAPSSADSPGPDESSSKQRKLALEATES